LLRASALADKPHGGGFASTAVIIKIPAGMSDE
jgi:hypothetical protein